MKVKDLERTANVAWSPRNHSPILLAAGTAAQQLDASFNTNATLELYALNVAEPGPDMVLKSSVTSEHRFHKIIWGAGESNGTIIGGCDGGLIQIYDTTKLLRNESALICQPVKHTGAVHALDFNPYQANLFATGAADSEIFIWDINNTNTPMTPGAKSQPLETVLAIAWNRQVQHILASTFPSKCVIWDLRKNEPIIKLSDTVLSSRVRWKSVAWHPDVATQLCLASEEDHSPVIQLWDLRFATSPLKTLENHQRGILSIAWCTQDANLLVSCGKDNRILCWNPNSNEANGEILSEIAKTNQWNFDVQWCPQNPAILACPSYDGHVSVYSLMGGKTQQIQTTDKIADSFPGMEGYVQAPVPQGTVSSAPVSVDLSKAPKWMKRPVGASFGFGGKLITFDYDKSNQTNQNVLIKRTVQISQVITEPDLVQKSSELEQALEYGNFKDFCLNKADSTSDQHKKYIWYFLKANFDENPRAELLNLLGYRIEDINCKLEQVLGKQKSLLPKNNTNNIVDDLADELSCINRLDELPNNDVDPFDSIAQPAVTNLKTQKSHFQIKTGDDSDGLITQALLLGNVEAAVELCLNAKRYADAIIIAMTGGSDLLARTQRKYLEQCTDNGYVSTLISALVTDNWTSIITNCDLMSWKEALAATLTHSSDDTLPVLCEQLGNRLANESENDNKLIEDAQLCYICSGSFDKLVNSWSDNALKSTENLQELVELVMLLQRAIERQGRQIQVSGALANLLSHYAFLLASQGNLTTALTYLMNNSQDEKITSLRDRLLFVCHGKKSIYEQTNRQPIVGGGGSRRPSGRQSFSSYTNNFIGQNQQQQQVIPPQQQQQQQPPVFVPPPLATTTRLASGYIEPVTRTFSPGPSVSSLPPPIQPPPPPQSPSNLGSSTGSSLHSRKYVLDPSVSSNQYGFGGRNNNNVLYQPTLQQSSIPPPIINNNNPLYQQNNSMVSGVNNMFNPLIPAAGQDVVASQFAPPPPPIERTTPINYGALSTPGWNDPPALNKPLRSSQQLLNKSDLNNGTSEPITHPLYGSATPNVIQQQPQPNANFNEINQNYHQLSSSSSSSYGGNNNTTFGQPQQPTIFQPQLPPPAAANSNFNAHEGGFKPNALSAGYIPQENQTTGNINNKLLHQSVVQKGPIPEEHLHMQTVLDELKNQCSCTANNPQTKRKLEDVGRKLESLYDLLREHKLSPNTLSSLHQMVQLIQNGDYTGGLNLHTQLVSGPDFAQIASFMPGLKVLLQCALQLQVYLR